jgi:hypothetical protein
VPGDREIYALGAEGRYRKRTMPRADLRRHHLMFRGTISLGEAAMSGQDDTPVDSVSRRQILKRIGAGTAVIWSAPALTSLGSPAWAQAYPPGLCRPTNPFCDPGLLCEESPACQPDCPGLQCTQTLDGSCVCWFAATCNTGDELICQTDADCEFFFPGSKCGAITDCPTSPCGTARACFAPCTPDPGLQRAPRQQPGAAIAYAR